MLPSEPIFLLNTHLQPIGLRPSGNGKRSHVLFLLRAVISFSMTVF